MSEDIFGTELSRGLLLFRLAVFGFALLFTSGCSFLFVNGPPADYREQEHVNCTTSRVAPIVDTLVAAVQTVRTGLALALEESDYRGMVISRSADIALGIAFTALFGVSAGHGFSRTYACEKARNTEGKRLLDRRPSATTTVPAAKPAPVTPLPLTTAPVCTYDAQCQGDQICERGHCVEFNPPPSRPPSSRTRDTPQPATPANTPPRKAPEPSEP